MVTKAPSVPARAVHRGMEIAGFANECSFKSFTGRRLGSRAVTVAFRRPIPMLPLYERQILCINDRLHSVNHASDRHAPTSAALGIRIRLADVAKLFEQPIQLVDRIERKERKKGSLLIIPPLRPAGRGGLFRRPNGCQEISSDPFSLPRNQVTVYRRRVAQ